MIRFGDLCSTRSRDRSIAPPGPRAAAGGPPRLMVSVRNASEAAEAIAAGADVLDLKDPRRGPLGACDLTTLRAVAALRDRRAPRVPLSAAVGPARGPRAFRLAELLAKFGYDAVKTGLEGLASESAATAALARLAATARASNPGMLIIAATYADAASAGALPHRALPQVTARAGLDGCLLDTATKGGRPLTGHLDLRDLAAWVAECRAGGLIAALAGSLRETDLAAIAGAGPDLIGARGSLCDGGRNGRLDAQRVAAFRAALADAWVATRGERVRRRSGRPEASSSGRRAHRSGAPRPPDP
jgi:(5-formylfuran-3-yl)methyl phosphate synthase